MRAPGWLPTPARHRMRTSLDDVRAVIDEAIETARSEPDSDAGLIKLLLEASDPDTGERLTDEQIRDELFVFLIAGHDTTSTTLAYSLWALGRDPDLQDRLAQEVAELGDRPLTVDDLPALPLTVRVIHEALRLCPPAPIIVRSAMRDTIVDGHRIPAGTQVIVGVYAHPPRSRVVARSGAIRPRPVRHHPADRRRSLAIPAVRGGATVLHRRPLRHAGGHSRARHRHRQGPDRLARRRVPDRTAVHADRRRAGSARVTARA